MKNLFLIMVALFFKKPIKIDIRDIIGEYILTEIRVGGWQSSQVILTLQSLSSYREENTIF